MSGVGLRSERGPILLALMLSIFIVAMDSTIVATAVPTIVRDLGDFELFPWLFSASLLAQAATVPVYAKLADTFGRRPVLFTGIGIFVVGCVFCAMAWSMPSLILARALQGIGAGAVLPVSLTIASDIYTMRERAQAQAYLSSVWGIAAVMGPTMGGLLSQLVSWRWIFLISIPLALTAILLLWRSYRPAFERHRSRIDYGGAVLLVAALVLLVLGILQSGHAWPWPSWQTAVTFGGGVTLLVIFALVERRAADPVLPPWVLRDRLHRTASLASLGVGIVLLGVVSFTPTFLEAVVHAPPIVAGLTVASLSVGWTFSGAWAGALYFRLGFRITMMIGAAIVLVGAGALAFIALAPSVVWIAIACLIVGFGLGFVANPALIASQSFVEMRQRGVVSGVNSLFRSIGSAIGVAVLGAIANGVIAAQGGSGDAGAVQAGGIAVFLTLIVIGVALLIVCACIPAVPLPEAQASRDQPPAGR